MGGDKRSDKVVVDNDDEGYIVIEDDDGSDVEYGGGVEYFFDRDEYDEVDDDVVGSEYSEIFPRLISSEEVHEGNCGGMAVDNECIRDVRNVSVEDRDECCEFLRELRNSAAKLWMEQIHTYEDTIYEMEDKIYGLKMGMRAAKRCREEDMQEIERLRDLAMEKTREANEKDAKIYELHKKFMIWKKSMT